ncbi:MAG: HU family DNA-binding protein [Tannerella sp.]|jgi:DNA-binding protein HU-beta|nr:HU family DNA-binding protein [Tannerella sp.]
MNKTKLIKEVSAKTGQSREEVKKTVNVVIETISEEMSQDGKVGLLGFGTFYVIRRSARRGVNPATKQIIQIPAGKTVKFKAGTDLARVVK